MRYLVSLLAVLFLLPGCKKDDGPEPEPDSGQIMKIRFVNDFVPEPFKVIVFLSNPDGSLFTDTSFASNDQHTILNGRKDAAIPDSFLVTIVRYDLYWHSLLIRMNTYQGTKGADWTVTGMEPDTIGQATVSFTNIPDFAGLALYSNPGYYNYTSSTNPQTCLIYGADDDFYMKLKTDAEGPRYKWLEGFLPGGQYTLDLAEMEVPATVNISLPFTAGYYEGRLWGFSDQTFNLGYAFLFDMVLAGLNPQDNLDLCYPPGRYENYRTHLMIRESFLTPDQYYHNSTGDIPASFRRIAAGISNVDVVANQVSIDASGQYDVQKAFYYSYNSNNEIYEWNLYAPAASESIVVPELSPLLFETFPALENTAFTLKHTELIDFAEGNSYKEMLQDIFDTLQPKVIDQLNYSSVVRSEDR